MQRDETERIYRAHADALMRFATTVVGADSAHDVFTDAWIRATNSRAWRSTENPLALLYRAVLHTALNRTRSDTRRVAREQRVAVPDVAPGVDADRRIDIERALQRLSDRQRAVIHLTYWEDRRAEDIGDLLGISEGSVKRHLARGRQKMRELL